MDNQTYTKSRISPALIQWTFAGIFLLLLAAYAYVYYGGPLDTPDWDYLDYQVTSRLTVLPAIAAAALGLLVTAQFQPGEPPRRIWLFFSLGWLCWVAGEISDMVYNYVYWYEPALPELTWTDLCWSVGYLFFGLALYHQFRLAYGLEKSKKTWIYAAGVALALLLTAGLTILARRAGLGEDYSWFARYVGVMYPVFDLAAGGAAVWLSLLFGRGKWGRQWWALIAFAISDGFGTFFWMGGGNQLSDDAYNLIDTVSSTIYVAGYVIAALAFLSHYFMLRYGPTVSLPGQVEEETLLESA